jgi:hypothetical protein
MVLGLALTACTPNNRVEVIPVTGEVVVHGKPAESAIVTFCPTDGSLTRAFVAIADAQGRFQPTTYEAGDGLPAGEYEVTVLWPAPRKPDPNGDRRPGDDEGPDQLEGRFANRKTSGLKATVTRGTHESLRFDLK